MFLIRFIFLLQGYGWTLLHQRRSEAAVRIFFYKIGVLEIFLEFKNSLENTYVGITFL